MDISNDHHEYNIAIHFNFNLHPPSKRKTAQSCWEARKGTDIHTICTKISIHFRNKKKDSWGVQNVVMCFFICSHCSAEGPISVKSVQWFWHILQMSYYHGPAHQFLQSTADDLSCSQQQQEVIFSISPCCQSIICSHLININRFLLWRIVQCNLCSNMRDLTELLNLGLNADLHISSVKPCSESESHYRFITKIESLSKPESKLSLESKFLKTLWHRECPAWERMWLIKQKGRQRCPYHGSHPGWKHLPVVWHSGSSWVVASLGGCGPHQMTCAVRVTPLLTNIF